MNIETMTLEEIEARRAELVERSNAIADETASCADVERLEALYAEATAIADERTALREREEAINAAAEERAAQMAEVLRTGKEVRTTTKEENTMSNMEIRNSAEYIDAYANYIKTESDRECRALLTENVNGTVPVPEFVYDVVKTAWERDGIMALVRKTYMQGNLKVGFEISATAATNHTEAANSAVTEETLVLGVVNLIPVSIKKWISISDEVNDMRGEAFLRYIYDELTYQIAKKAADNLIDGIVACGTQSTTTCVGVPVVTATAASVGLVAAAMSALSAEAANPVVVLNRASWGAFKSAAYAASYGIDPFEGLRVVYTDALKSVAAATTGDTFAIVGDFGHGAIANFPAGDEIEIKMDDKTLMEKDLIRILGREYVAVAPVAPNAFVKINKA